MKTLLILVDGMRPDSLEGIPEAQKFISESAGSLKATTVYPSVTLPCHMSLFLSVPPERHGTTTNTYSPQVRPVDGICEVLSRNGQCCGIFYNWPEIRDVVRPGSVVREVLIYSDDQVAEESIRFIRKADPDFVFTYLGWVDGAGHDHGWMSDKYMDQVRNSWRLIGELMKEVNDDWTVIVTADHGGHGRGHGDDIPEDMTIPLFFRGKNFEPGSEIEGLNIMDIAPTILKLHGCEIPREWEGKSRVRIDE